MSALFDAEELKRRVAASESQLRSSAEGDRERSTQLLELLEAVETSLVHNQERIYRLEEKQGRALEAFQRLRNPLQDSLVGPPRPLSRWVSPKSHEARAQLVDRLDALDAMMKGGVPACRGRRRLRVAWR
jgi:hypothetical protein